MTFHILFLDAHRALELLEEYHRSLGDPQQKPLKQAIERVIRIFKSRLFQALVDIQEYYEHTLLDDTKTTDQKMDETMNVVTKWERGASGGPVGSSGSSATASRLAQPRSSEKPPGDKENVRPPLVDASPQNTSAISARANSPVTSAPSPSTQHDKVEDTDEGPLSPAVMLPPPGDWVYEEVTLERNSAGLGFSIAGGTDNPHVEEDPGIFITRIIPGGAAAATGHIFLNDVIVSVNGVDISAVSHSQAVDALKAAGNQVQLVMRRLRPMPPPETLIRIELIKGSRGLGFSIAGGRGNQHVVGDDSIYITRVIDGGAAATDGRLAVGDRLLAVNDMDLTSVTHDEAVNILKSIHDRVVLIVAKPAPSIEGVSTPQPTSPVPQVQASPQYVKQLQVAGSEPNPEPPINRGTRNVLLKKSSTGFGFNIVGGERTGSGIFISFILPGGAADLQGELQRGDRIITVNGHDLRTANHEEAAAVLKSCLDSANIVVAFCPEDYEVFEQRMRESSFEQPPSPVAPIAGDGEVINPVMTAVQQSQQSQPIVQSQSTVPHTLKALQRREFYVRAMFEYDPARDSGLPGKGLPFRHGDILHVTNAADEEWWQAKRVNTNGTEEGLGIIPSKRRVEKRERTRMKNVKFRQKQSEQQQLNSAAKASVKSGKLGRLFGKKNKDEFDDENEIDSGGEGTITNKGLLDEKILSYELVSQHDIDYCRPIVILGPLKGKLDLNEYFMIIYHFIDRINDDLISEFPDRFASAVPHTTRAKRDNEIDGRDYYFVSREQMEQDIQNHLFIEAGQYNDNLYGTSVTAVRELAYTDKHCVLDVSGNAIRRLQANGLFPIAILIKPISLDQIKEWNKRLTDEQVQKLFDRTCKLENDFGEYFTAVVTAQNATIEDMYVRVKDVVSQQAGPIVWLPTKEKL